MIYEVFWRLEIEAGSIEEARTLHMDALDVADDIPAAIWVQGDGVRRQDP